VNCFELNRNLTEYSAISPDLNLCKPTPPDRMILLGVSEMVLSGLWTGHLAL
jgi:hypothetical protein